MADTTRTNDDLPTITKEDHEKIYGPIDPPEEDDDTQSEISDDGEEEDEYEMAWEDVRRENEWRQHYGMKRSVEEIIYVDSDSDSDNDSDIELGDDDTIQSAKRPRI